MSLTLKNPHSILAALEMRPQDVQQINLPKSSSAADAWEQVERVARKEKIAVEFKTGEARVREHPGVSVEELFEGARERQGGHGLWLALDGLQDPHNVGAIFRTAAFFGVQGIVLTQERSAPLSSAVYDVASGGIEYVAFNADTNLQRAFEAAKDAGLWILGTSEHAHDDISSVKPDRPWLLVFGSEERGLRRLTEEACDVLCKVAARGRVGSLNVSVAAGICIERLAVGR